MKRLKARIKDVEKNWKRSIYSPYRLRKTKQGFQHNSYLPVRKQDFEFPGFEDNGYTWEAE